MSKNEKLDPATIGDAMAMRHDGSATEAVQTLPDGYAPLEMIERAVEEAKNANGPIVFASVNVIAEVDKDHLPDDEKANLPEDATGAFAQFGGIAGALPVDTFAGVLRSNYVNGMAPHIIEEFRENPAVVGIMVANEMRSIREEFIEVLARLLGEGRPAAHSNRSADPLADIMKYRQRG